MLHLLLAPILLFPLIDAPVSAAAPAIADIKEWTVPYASSRPRDPSVAPDGTIWFVGQQSDYAAQFTPATGQFRRVDLPAGAGPHTIFVDKLGRPWYTGNAASHIGRIDPGSGSVTQFPVPSPARDPHTITFAPDKSMWFSSQQGNSIGRLDTATGTVELLTPSTTRSLPYGIVTAPDGIIWVALFGTSKLGRVNPAAKRLTEVALPRAACRPRRIAATSDGAIWYVDYAGGYLGRHIPSTGATKEWPAPSAGNSMPYAMTSDDRDRIWFVETGPRPNRLVRFDPKTETFAYMQVLPSGGATIRHMVFDAPTRSIWFGTDANTLGRATLVEAATGTLSAPGMAGLSLRMAGSRLAITLPPGQAGRGARFSIYSPAGGRHAHAGEAMTPDTFTLPMDPMAAGWYLFELKTSEGRWVRPFRVAP